MLLSIITPSYQSAATLESAIERVLEQDYPAFEHIIIDGGSGDDTVAILKKYPHLKWVSEPDRGQSDAMNKGFQLAKGDVIGYLNADDRYAPGVFGEVMTNFKVGNPRFIYGNLIRVHENHEVFIDREYTYNTIIFGHQFPRNPSSYFYHRSIQESIGPFPLENHYTMDLWFLLRVFRHFPVQKLDRLLGYFYMIGNHKTSQVDTKTVCSKEIKRYLLRYDPFNLIKYHFNRVRE